MFMKTKLLPLLAMAAIVLAVQPAAQAQTLETQIQYGDAISDMLLPHGVTVNPTVKTQITFAEAEVAQGVAVNPITNQIYVSTVSVSSSYDNLAIVDGKTDTVTATLSVPPGVQLVAVNPLTNRVYIVTMNTYVSLCTYSVTVVDGNTQAVIVSIPLDTSTLYNEYMGIAVDPLTNKVYVANPIDNVIDVISGASNKISKKIPVNGVPV